MKRPRPKTIAILDIRFRFNLDTQGNDYIKKISNIEQGIMNYEVKK